MKGNGWKMQSMKAVSYTHLWDMQLLEYGTRIIRKRKEFVEELNEIKLMANDMELGIETRVEGDITERGVIAPVSYTHLDRH